MSAMNRLPRPFVDGMLAAMPLVPGFIPFGILTGISAIQAGMPPLTAQLSSLLLMSGASQIAAASLMVAHSPPVMIVLTHWIINLRYLIYSAGLSTHKLAFTPATRVLAAHLLIDQTYALSHLHYETNRLSARERTQYYFGTTFPLWLSWQLFTAVGIVFGQVVPERWELDFAITLCFVSLLVPVLKNRPMLLAGLVSGAIAVPLYGLPYNLGLFVSSLCGVMAGISAEYWRARDKCHKEAS